MCGQIDIGNVESDMTADIGSGTLQADGQVSAEPRISADNVAKAVAFMDSLDLSANIPFLTIMASEMALYGRG